MRKYSDNLLTGILAGIISPVIAFRIYVLTARPGESFKDVLSGFLRLNVLTHVISLAVLSNLLIFFLFIWSNRDRSAKGVFMSTLGYLLVVLILKLI